ncbi:nucleoside diphosphate kinase [Lepraria neglecta]|uniref:Nucleoside diphosphate kinase n=1 Tax=Lepraria neglecta TaxID=209136 RepID=A0AAD9Z4I3_9LECA|nr:nucleoside diphosphate kinase [Lepraria neglecta]
MAEETTSTPTQEPPIYKHLNPKTAALLRQTNKARAEQEKAAIMSNEQTFIAIKPDGVQRGLIGEIIGPNSSCSYKLVALKLVTPSKEHLEKHYEDLSQKPFYKGLVTSLLGATNPLDSAPGTIRGDFAIDVGRNVCHGSDAVESAKKEIALWFKEGEVLEYKQVQHDWIYEK